MASVDGLRRVLLASLCALSVCAGAQTDYPGAIWNAADSTNQTVANRPNDLPIDYVLIHYTVGTYAGAISWFKNPSSDVSAHYVIRASDGQITQMVRHKNIAWHAGNWWYNQRSIGIEHEYYDPLSIWFTPTQYRASATLVQFLTDQNAIPRTREFILGHREVRSTSCPGPFDFDLFMAMVRHRAEFSSSTIPLSMAPGQVVEVVVRMRNSGEDPWSPTTNAVRLLTANPSGRSSPFFTAGDWPASWYPSDVEAPTPGGQTGEFRFRLTAPQVPGVYNEAFQLNQPVIGWFGPVVNFAIDVNDSSSVLDNRGAEFSTTTGWTRATSAVDKYGEDYWFASTGAKRGAEATWDLSAALPGTYDAWAWWSQGTNRASDAMYLLENSREQTARKVDQRAGGGTWNYLGRIRVLSNGARIRLTNLSKDASKVVIADAVRIRRVTTGGGGGGRMLAPFATAMPAARLLAQLPLALRESAVNGEPVRVDHLDLRGIFALASPGSTMSPSRRNLAASGVLGEPIWLHIQSLERAIEVRSPARGVLLKQDAVSRPSRWERTTWYRIGTSPQDCVTYEVTVPIAQPKALPYDPSAPPPGHTHGGKGEGGLPHSEADHA